MQGSYPSVDSKMTAKVCRDRVMTSKLDIEGVDYRWATIYLKLTMTNLEIVDAKVEGLLPRKINGRKATIRTVEADEKEERWWWPKPVTLMTKDEKKRLIGCVVEQLVKLVFNTHFYEWDGKTYRQK